MPTPCRASIFRLATATLVLACAINQSSIKALGLETVRFDTPPTTADHVALIATLVSVPATLLALENPDFNSLAFIEHASKAVVEGIAFGKYSNKQNLIWCSYDTVQALRRLWAAFHSPIFRDPNAPADDVNAPETADITKSAKRDDDDASRLKLILGILLALIEGGVRMHNVVHNQTNPTMYVHLLGDGSGESHDPIAERYLLDHFIELARLANYSLYTESNIQLLCYMALFVIFSMQAYRQEGGFAKRVEIIPLNNNTATPATPLTNIQVKMPATT